MVNPEEIRQWAWTRFDVTASYAHEAAVYFTLHVEMRDGSRHEVGEKDFHHFLYPLVMEINSGKMRTDVRNKWSGSCGLNE